MTPLLVGLDIGTTSIKAVVYEPDGRAVGRAAVPTPTHYPRPGWAYHVAEELWLAAVAVLREALAAVPDPRAVVGIAVASVGEAIVPLDARGEPTAEVVAWFDTRARPQAAWLDRTVGKDALFARSGVSLQPIFSLCKLLWLRDERPEAWARTKRWLMAADYLAWRLCGVAATDHSLASRTLMLNLHTLEWDAETLAAAGIDPGLLAPLAPGGLALGRVTPEAARQTGLPQACVVATGGHDHVCGALAAGVTEPGQMLNSLGTAEAVFMPIERPLTDPQAGRQGYTQGAHVVGGRPYVFAGQYTSGACVAWVRDLVGNGDGYETLLAEAAAAPPGSLGVCFLPHLRLANPPHDDPKSRGAFVGLSTDVGRGALVRATLEGLAFETRATYEPLFAYPEVTRPASVRVIGGSTRNDLLMGIKATVMGQPLTVVEAEEATALGAAILGGLGAGVYPDVAGALASLDLGEHAVEPNPAERDLYEQIYQRVYRPLYDRVAPLSRAAVEIQGGEG
ncbi:MAG: FGGY-family carbohydrate kinase [Chloroflexia bacterium]|nr:FGGY-family carbohydrate kinase [Chloroflexia bacterium]